MNPRSLLSEIGIGATAELSLRVSVGALVRVLFEHPKDGELMLALERKATVLERGDAQVVDVKSQAFGGALQLLDLSALRKQVSDFHFDSEQSRAEQDFRIFIRPSDWESIQEFCLDHIRHVDNSVLETDPSRELAEEFADTLRTGLKPDHYTVQAVGIIVEEHPSPTEFIYAAGYPTARIYRIFEARILDSSLASAMIRNSETYPDQELRELALQDFRNGGRGRANAVIALPYQEIPAFYLATLLENRNRPIWFQGHQLDETVAAVLDDVSVPKYRKIS